MFYTSAKGKKGERGSIESRSLMGLNLWKGKAGLERLIFDKLICFVCLRLGLVTPLWNIQITLDGLAEDETTIS